MGFPGDFLRSRPVGRHGDRHDRTPTGAASPRLDWVPIRPLAPRHRQRILAHLLALSDQDRYLRFGHAASDAQIAHYVEQIDFERDEVFGIFNRRLELVAAAHLAAAPGSTEAEFGVSVLAKARGRGYGARLFDRAVLHARNRGIREMVIYALSENTAMLRIVRKAGATVDRDGGESCARLRLPADDLMSHLEALVEDSASEVDYRLKQGTRRDAPPSHER
jgi:ribosomal protein S18 acetylase RimI-like enzyme